jgi:2-dehydropantoate 2-reductase
MQPPAAPRLPPHAGPHGASWHAAPMGYVVLGAGAIGAVVGGRLFQAGCEVTLIGRGAHLQALQACGLRLDSPASTDTVRLAAVGHPREIDWHTSQVVLMAVKSQQSRSALCELAAVAPPATPIVCLQNVIANEPAALRMFTNVQGVSVACPTSHLEAGVVQAWSTTVTGLLDIGVYPIGINQVSEAVAADFRGATFSSHPVEDIRRWKHRKLLTNLGNAIEAVCGPHERTGPLGDMLLAEGEAVLSAAGLEAATAEEDRDRRADLLHLGQISGQTRPGGSSWQSLRRATGDIETDYLNGEIVLLGRIHGVPTPANELLQRLARELAVTRDAPGATPAATILERLEKARKPAGATSV